MRYTELNTIGLILATIALIAAALYLNNGFLERAQTRLKGRMPIWVYPFTLALILMGMTAILGSLHRLF
jgi:hypothetical protein